MDNIHDQINEPDAAVANRFLNDCEVSRHPATTGRNTVITGYTPKQRPDLASDKKQIISRALYSIFQKYGAGDADGSAPPKEARTR